MTDLRAAAQQALDFIRWSQFVPCRSEPFPEPPSTAPQVEAALKAALAEDALQRFTDVNQELEAALAEPVQEPVAWRYGALLYHDKLDALEFMRTSNDGYQLEPLYSAPPQRPAELGQASTDVPLTVYVVKKAEPQEPVAWSHINGTSDTKWHPPQRPAEPVQEPVAWMYSDDHERMLKRETFCTVYSVKVGSPDKGVTDVPLFTAPPQRKPPATNDEMFDRMDKAPKGVFFGHDPMTIWMEAWRAAEQHHGIT